MQGDEVSQVAAGKRSEVLSRVRSLIAQRMVESLQTTAQLTSVVEVDVTAIDALRRRWNAEFNRADQPKLSFLPFFARGAIDALLQHPIVNARLDFEQRSVTYHDFVHLAVAVDTDRGLLVPVIRDAHALSIMEMSQRIADIAATARARRLLPDDLSGGTFTISNTGSRGSLFDTPIINQPQSAILGTGAVVRRPVVVRDRSGDEAVEIRSMAYVALTYDHRLVDGADAARFLVSLKSWLEGGQAKRELAAAGMGE